jgi:hypothetical protein
MADWLSFLALLGGLYLVFIILGFIFLILGILTLIHQAKRSLWIWFVLTLIFGIVLPIYWIVWLFKRKKWNRRK